MSKYKENAQDMRHKYKKKRFSTYIVILIFEDSGVFRSIWRGKIGTGRRIVSLVLPNRTNIHPVHRIFKQAFLPPPQSRESSEPNIIRGFIFSANKRSLKIR